MDKGKFQRESKTFPKEWVLNDATKAALLHRTIRQFTDTPVAPAAIDMLEHVANQTATSMGLQQASWIRITDKETAKKIAAVCKQDYVAEAPELWIFIVDLYRNYALGKEQGFEMPDIRSIGKFFGAYSDALLMAQNVYLALESLDMGGVYLGTVLNAPLEVVKILQMPKLTFPVLGLAFGYANESPQLKPRIPIAVRRSENKYQILENYACVFEEYDKEISECYNLRKNGKSQDPFTVQVKNKYSSVNIVRNSILSDVEAQGFQLSPLTKV